MNWQGHFFFSFLISAKFSFWFKSISLLFYMDWLPIDLKSLLCQLRLKSQEFQAFGAATAELFSNFKPHPNAGVNHLSSACWHPSSLSIRERCFRSRVRASIEMKQVKLYKYRIHFLPLISYPNDFLSDVSIHWSKFSVTETIQEAWTYQ